jgi:signal transduction histidine kinase
MSPVGPGVPHADQPEKGYSAHLPSYIGSDAEESLNKREQPTVHFDVSVGLKRVLGRELITDDEVAILEMVKNSFDAGAKNVHLYFDAEKILVVDDGSGMDADDLRNKWLFVAYSAKRSANAEDFRDKAASRGHLAGSKGIGRFSSDRLGQTLILQTRPEGRAAQAHRLEVDWAKFERDDRQHFETIPVEYEPIAKLELPPELKKVEAKLTHGTIIEITRLRRNWNRADLVSLKATLSKLINPFGNEADTFSIELTAPVERDADKVAKQKAEQSGNEISSRDIVNGKVGNFIFSDLRAKTTFLKVTIKDGYIHSQLTDRGEIIYEIREPNPYDKLEDAGFYSELYYLNQSAKLTFARRIGLPSVNFGSVFLFRNGFRVFPIGEADFDWFGYDRRKQQGYNRFLGSREIIGRVDVFGSEDDFQEASSRNQGLIETPAARELRQCFMEHCLKRLEKYVVPVSWVDSADSTADDLSRLLTDPGKARVAAVVAKLIDNDDVELIRYSQRLIGILNERSERFEASLSSLRAIAEKTKDRKFLDGLTNAERRFEELKRAETEARKVADQQRAVALRATERADKAEAAAEIDRRRANFLESAVGLDVKKVLNLHHQVTIYSVELNQQIENLIQDTRGKRSISREELVNALEQISMLNRRIEAATKFAMLANFELDSGMIEANLPDFIEEYIKKVSVLSGRKRTRVEVINEHEGLEARFNPMDIAIVVENLISNAKKAEAREIVFRITGRESKAVSIDVSDNGRGLSNDTEPDRIFEMGYTNAPTGSGLGLYHVRQVLGEMNGSIEFDQDHEGPGLAFKIVIAPRRK